MAASIAAGPTVVDQLSGDGRAASTPTPGNAITTPGSAVAAAAVPTSRSGVLVLSLVGETLDEISALE